MYRFFRPTRFLCIFTGRGSPQRHLLNPSCHRRLIWTAFLHAFLNDHASSMHFCDASEPAPYSFATFGAYARGLVDVAYVTYASFLSTHTFSMHIYGPGIASATSPQSICGDQRDFGCICTCFSEGTFLIHAFFRRLRRRPV